MEKLKRKIMNFMRGRYGADQLYNALVISGMVLYFLGAMTDLGVLVIVAQLLIFWALFRVYSKKIYKRAEENRKFLKWWQPNQKKLKLLFRRFKEIKVARFRKCPNCKTTLRLPVKRGKKTVKCPTCHQKFESRIIL
ncbi:hypothetical protein [uncultured Trichococcus sp.]|uniref:hypothetical protein n=1 Tax=uncultured Trichococcus sp. TaxID=189665 RepID=UPI002A1879F1|nr:hypothetical protein [uncultured Trichococcus sp.]